MDDATARVRAALKGRYGIEREIGVGGMATVHLARDIRHDRRVAVKVLRPELGAVLGVERFLAEIKVTANLQHPNLLPLFDSGEADGLLYYVMPYVEGESLRATLEREKQLPVDDALRIAVAVAGALDYAHRHGVIHRDLKPENILLHEGQPLVADFGIALAVSNAGGNRITQTGLSLGTPQYMSPEQATGDRVIDGRTDIYSLGAVLYEMLTGDPPHVGSTSQAIIARVLTEKPRSVRATRPSVPEHVEWAVERALEKLSADRFSTAQEFADALQGRGIRATASLGASGAAVSARAEGRAGWRAALRNPVVAGLVAVGAAASAAGAWLLARPARSDAGDAIRFELTIPDSQGVIGGVGPPFAISPDGRLYAYRTLGPDGLTRLYLRRLDVAVGRGVPGTTNVLSFTFSPDGKWLAFQQGDEIRRIEVGAATTSTKVADFPGGTAAGIAWTRDALVTGNLQGGLWKIPPDGGARVPFTTLDSAGGETSHRSPAELAGGDAILFAIYRTSGTTTIGVASARTGEHTDLGIAGTAPLGVVAGLLVYHSGEGAILGVPFDATRRRVTGTPIPLLEDVSYVMYGYSYAALSASGSFVYLARGLSGLEREMVEVSLNGQPTAFAAPRRRFSRPRYSPDGRRIAANITITAASGLVDEAWVYDIASKTLSPLTRGQSGQEPSWSPDGKYVVYTSNRRGRWELFRQLADGSAPAELLQPASADGQPVQGMFTPDGRYLVYRVGFRTSTDDLWYRALTGDTTSKPLAADQAYVERNPSVSPDGRWVAYATNETGSYQVYVRAFPGPGPRFAVTIDSGDAPVWSRDGRKIYYRVGQRFEEAAVTFTPEFSVKRRALFDGPYLGDGWFRGWDLSPDGKRALVVRELGAEKKQPAYVVYNWAAEVRARRAGRR